jgi:hypothetical protein
MNGYGYPYYVGQLPPQSPQSSATGPVTKKLIEAFAANYGRAPSTWLEVVDFLLAGAIETAGEQAGLNQGQINQRFAAALRRYR